MNSKREHSANIDSRLPSSRMVLDMRDRHIHFTQSRKGRLHAVAIGHVGLSPPVCFALFGRIYPSSHAVLKSNLHDSVR